MAHPDSSLLDGIGIPVLLIDGGMIAYANAAAREQYLSV